MCFRVYYDVNGITHSKFAFDRGVFISPTLPKRYRLTLCTYSKYFVIYNCARSAGNQSSILKNPNAPVAPPISKDNANKPHVDYDNVYVAYFQRSNLIKSDKKLARLQRWLSRRQKGSSGWHNAGEDRQPTQGLPAQAHLLAGGWIWVDQDGKPECHGNAAQSSLSQAYYRCCLGEFCRWGNSLKSYSPLKKSWSSKRGYPQQGSM